KAVSHVYKFSLSTRQTLYVRDQLLTDDFQILQSLFQTKILDLIDADLHPKEGRKLLIHARDQAFAIDAQHMMAMVELFQQAVQFAAESGVLAYAEDLSDLVSGQAEHPQFC